MMTLKKIYMLASISIIVLVNALASYWLFWPYHVVDVQVPLHVLTPRVEAGGTLEYEVEYCKYTDGPAVITKQLLGQRETVLLPEITTNLPKGCSKGVRKIPLPTSITADTYVLHMTGSYPVNPIRKQTYTWNSEPFIVYKK